MDIDPRYIDVDFTKEPQYVYGDTGPRDTFAGPAYEENVPLVDRSRWPMLAEQIAAEKTGLDQLITRVFNQKSEGSCVGNATTQGVQTINAKQVGKEGVTQLSAISLYKQIGSSPNSGANVADALDAIRDVGILPLDTPENRAKYGACVMPHTGFRTPFPDNWKETAKQFRGVEAFIVRSVEGLISSLFNGHPVIVGRQGHSILYLRAMYSSGRLCVLYVNSWGDWGQAAGDFSSGFGVDSESQIRQSAGWAFALRSTTFNG